MILVLLGTQNNSFKRLLNELESLISIGKIQDSIFVQSGYTKFFSKFMDIHDFVSKDEMQNLINSASVIITHGGVGSILSCIRQNKKVIAIPRLSKFGEHVNDHQIQIVENFDEHGYIKGVFDIADLGNTLLSINNFVPIPFNSNSGKIIDIIEEFISNN